LREKIGEDGADDLIALINKANDWQKEDILVFGEEKFERQLADELSKVNDKIAETRKEISLSKANMIKWMFIFWVGQIGAIVAILFVFFSK